MTEKSLWEDSARKTRSGLPHPAAPAEMCSSRFLIFAPASLPPYCNITAQSTRPLQSLADGAVRRQLGDGSLTARRPAGCSPIVREMQAEWPWLRQITGPVKRVDGKRRTANDERMTWICRRTRILLTVCAWLGLFFQQMSVACSCCPFGNSGRTTSGTAESCSEQACDDQACDEGPCGRKRADADDASAASHCCQHDDPPAVGDPQAACCGLHAAAPDPSDCCGSCCKDSPLEAAVLVYRLPLPVVDGITTPVVCESPQTCKGPENVRTAGGDASLQRRLAKLNVWRN